ncbi:MAG: pyridoxal phosphate-dependent aminotransferase family protein [Candidatus Neomarinimicrobiota bacterium]|nr:aminotransferase class I/II-fold pyridoxal phosphate-dependent enzyme [Candidatus Neomarinimicrobiota bacterium]RKY56863.1 MAG: pyridoxal phosphate-dependent aminotransferase family protein [Candidatus Neomarinimicrobiota bacterium]
MKKLNKALGKYTRDLLASGRAKGKEQIITKVIKAHGVNGPRYILDGSQLKYIKMNSNSYLGLSMHPAVIDAEEKATRNFGVGPGAVRFISGSYKEHIDLEKTLASFHNREAAMIFSSAYVTSLGVISSLTTNETVVISDALNHNCIINAMRMSRPAIKTIYAHNNVDDLAIKLKETAGKGKRCLVITDGIFSMRGDHAPLDKIKACCEAYEGDFEEGVTLIVDDSHGVGACGINGRGTEELSGAKADVLIGTLGKAFGVNGGYVTGSHELISFLRESASTYIYSNPITVSESAAARKSIEICDSEEGKARLKHLKDMTTRFRDGLAGLGLESIPGEHPVVPLMVRDTQKTAAIVIYLRENGVLATGLNFPVVPKGEEEIRFQVCADHTPADIDRVLEVLKQFLES